MKIRFSAPNDLEVAGSAAELSAIAQQVSQLEAPERFTVSAETNFDPAPYAECLPTLTFAAGSGPVLVLADASGMRIAGSQQHLRSAQWYGSILHENGRPTLRCTGREPATCSARVRYDVACGSSPVSLGPLDA